MNALKQDIRHAFRALTRNPGFTAVAVLTLALGIAANTAIFSVFNAVFLRPLPYGDADRLVVLWTDDVKRQLPTTLVSYPVYANWKAQSGTFEQLGFTTRNTPLTRTGIAEPERLNASQASATMFEILGSTAAAGRTFTADEERRGDPVVVVSHRFAERGFQDDRSAVGKTIVLDDRATTIVGVMPAWFQFPAEDIDMWVPLGDRRARVIGIGRLRDEMTIEDARREINAIGEQLEVKYPELARDPDFPGFRANLVSFGEHVTGHDVRRFLIILLGAVFLVMSIACANVAGLSLARESSRRAEFAVRLALGASPVRIVRLIVVENILLAITAAVFGTVGAFALLYFVPSPLPRANQVALDVNVLTFTIALAMACGLVLAAAMARSRNRGNIEMSLRDAGRGLGSGRQISHMQRTLIVVEVALSVALVCGAGLLLRSLINVHQVPLGFDARQLLVFRVVVPDRFNDAQRSQFYRTVIERIGAIPGVKETAVVSNVFMSSTPNATIQVEGRPEALQAATKVIDDVASPEFFTALKVPLRGGRSFTEHDGDRAPHVAVVNERFAREFWPGENPIGRRFQFLDGRFDDPWITVIGIVGDMRRNGLEQPALPQVFLPFAQSPSRGADIIVTAGRQPLTHASIIRRTISGIHPGIPAYEISTLEQRVSSLFAARRFQTLLLWMFAAAGVLLSVMGLYGLTRLVAAQRRREIGIRLAIGASTISVVTMFLKEGLVLTLMGLGIGLAVAAALTQTLSTLVYGVSTTDPFTFAVAPAVLISAAILACAEPAWRAARVDPLLTLRCE